MQAMKERAREEEEHQICITHFKKRERIQEKPTAEQSERVTSRLNLRIEEYNRTVLIVATCQL